MKTVEEKMFPDGIPAFLSVMSFARLLGISRTKAIQIVDARPDMTVVLPSMKDRRIKSDLYFELIGKK